MPAGSGQESKGSRNQTVLFPGPTHWHTGKTDWGEVSCFGFFLIVALTLEKDFKIYQRQNLIIFVHWVKWLILAELSHAWLNFVLKLLIPLNKKAPKILIEEVPHFMPWIIIHTGMGSDQGDLWGGPWTHLAGAGPLGERTTGQEECAVCREGVPHSLGSLRVSHTDIYKEYGKPGLLHFLGVELMLGSFLAIVWIDNRPDFSSAPSSKCA